MKTTYAGAANAANAANAAKAELKKEFPGVKFSVRSDRYSIRIVWTDGPLSTHVETVTLKYQYGYFDGMDDCYKYDNRNDSIPQVKFVFCERKMSVEFTKMVVDRLNKFWGYDYKIDEKGGIVNDSFLTDVHLYFSELVRKEAYGIAM